MQIGRHPSAKIDMAMPFYEDVCFLWRDLALISAKVRGRERLRERFLQIRLRRADVGFLWHPK